MGAMQHPFSAASFGAGPALACRSGGGLHCCCSWLVKFELPDGDIERWITLPDMLQVARLRPTQSPPAFSPRSSALTAPWAVNGFVWRDRGFLAVPRGHTTDAIGRAMLLQQMNRSVGCWWQFVLLDDHIRKKSAEGLAPGTGKHLLPHCLPRPALHQSVPKHVPIRSSAPLPTDASKSDSAMVSQRSPPRPSLSNSAFVSRAQ